MAKRGRPAKDGDRYPSGELKRIGDPTPECASHRLAAVGTASHPAAPGYMSEARSAKLASYPLGILYARGLVSSGEHYAGRRYLGLFRRAVRSPHAAPGALSHLIAYGGIAQHFADLYGDDGQRQAANRIDYLNARQALQSCGRAVIAAFEGLVVYEQTDALFRQSLRDLAKDGLAELKRHFDAVDEKQRAATKAASA